MSTGATKEDFGNGNTQEIKSHRIVVGWREEASKYTAAGSNTSIGRYVMICSTPLEKKNLQVLKNRGAGSFRLITITHSRQGIPNLSNSIKRSIKILYIGSNMDLQLCALSQTCKNVANTPFRGHAHLT